MKRQSMYVLLVVTAVIIVSLGMSFLAFSYVMRAETNVRYVGLQNIISEKMAKTIKGMETNAKNVFDEVEKHLDSPESVIAALQSKTSLAPDVRAILPPSNQNISRRKANGSSLTCIILTIASLC